MLTKNLLILNTSQTEFRYIVIKQLAQIYNSSLATVYCSHGYGFIFAKQLIFSHFSYTTLLIFVHRPWFQNG